MQLLTACAAQLRTSSAIRGDRPATETSSADHMRRAVGSTGPAAAALGSPLHRASRQTDAWSSTRRSTSATRADAWGTAGPPNQATTTPTRPHTRAESRPPPSWPHVWSRRSNAASRPSASLSAYTSPSAGHSCAASRAAAASATCKRKQHQRPSRAVAGAPSAPLQCLRPPHAQRLPWR